MEGSNYLNYTSSSAGNSADMGLLFAFLPIYFIVVAVGIVALWRVFTKAGKPGWAAIVPFYNTWILAEVSGKPGWWGLVAILVSPIPFLGTIISIILILLISLGVAKNFGKSTVFGVIGLFLFSLVGYLILGFGKAKYQAVTNASSTPPTNSGTPEIFNAGPENKPEDTTNTPTPPQNPPTNLVQ